MPILSINSNLMAQNTADNLNAHYSRLATSIERLSSGLRVNSAADDAAGLAIRELMRADVAAFHQGVRNANDAISMIQTADGALSVIDEKLIRMKELAEQAATGTYDSTQRLMIHSEFQQMAMEIDRIANATDFNGIKLLDGSLAGEHDGSGLNATGKMKIHFGTGNESAEDYYYVEIGDCTTTGLGLASKQGKFVTDTPTEWINNATVDFVTKKIVLEIPSKYAGEDDKFLKGIDVYQLPTGLKNVTITSNVVSQSPIHKPHIMLFSNDGTQLTGPPAPDLNDNPLTWKPVIDIFGTTKELSQDSWWNYYNSTELLDIAIECGIFSEDCALDPYNTQYSTGSIINYNGITGKIIAGQTEIGALAAGGAPANSPDEIIFIDEITSNLVFFIGGHVNRKDGCNHYKLKIEAEFTDEFIISMGGSGNPPTLPSGGLIDIKTQEKAQEALERIDEAIVKKDKVRAHLGAMQNRLENTVTNLSIQAENLQAAESRISDVDVATEMTQFVRNQILTQSATAMLGQANSYPHMLMNLMNG